MRKLLSLLTAVLLSGSMWAADIVVTLENIGASLGDSPNAEMETTNITAKNTTTSYTLNYYQCKKQGSAMLMTKSVSPFISNHTAMPGDIKSVKVYINSGASGKTTYDCAFSASECTTATSGIGAINITGGNNHTFANPSVTGKRYFCITLGNAYNGQVLSVEITCASTTEPSVSLSSSTLTLNPTDVANQEITVTCSNFASSISSLTAGLYSNAECTSAYTVDPWITGISVNDAKTKVTFSVANNSGAQRQAWLKVTATDGTSTESAILAITQKKAPLATMQEIYDEATANGSTAKEAAITFNSWVVSGVSDYNAYVTDGTKGFVFNYSEHGFTVGQILTGTVYVNLKMSAKRATITGITNGTITKTAGGIITPVVVNINALGGINTGAPIIVKNVTYDGTYLKDAGDNAIRPFTELYSYPAATFTSGKTYNVTGIYVEKSTTKDIMPRSAADVAEIPAVAVNPTSWDFGTVGTSDAASKVFSVSGTNLETGTLTLTAPSGYSVTPNSIEISEATLAATEITIAKNTTTAGTYNNNLTISGCGLAQAVNVSLSMTLVTPVAVTGVTLNKSTLALETNETETLEATIAPNDATNKAVQWTTSDDKVATVDANGLVTAVKAGSATITCTSVADNTKSASCEVTITEHVITPGEYTIGLNATFFGTTAGSVISSTASGTEHDVTFEIGTTAGGKPRTDAGYVRFYQNNYLDISVPSGYVMTAISFAEPSTSEDQRWDGGVSADKGTYTSASKSWSGTEVSVRFSFSNQNRIASATINYKAGTPTALDEVDSSAKAVKVLRDGVLYIEKAGKTYNAQGQLVK